jgi:hypothetical protein
MTVQPAQLSLMPDEVPAPPASVIAQLPEEQLAAAIAELARMIANATATGGEVDDE